jgi:hypothetical protein
MKYLSIEQLAEHLNGKLWIKGDLKRIYLECGYNTKKMSTRTYIYERDGHYNVWCKIECPSQHDNWIDKEESDIIESVGERIAGIIEEHGVEIEDPKIAIQAALDEEEQVQGYYMRWKEVRVSINSYGKLATRKRQFVHTYKGAISKAPAGFVALNDSHFSQALEKEQKEAAYEYGQTPTFKTIEDAN